MSYLVSGYEERVGEVFESRVTRLNAWKDARVQRRHVRGARCTGSAAGVHERCAGRAGARAGARMCGRARRALERARRAHGLAHG
ncbi:hypothetical protein CRG98_014846 [Punica granatum]|uniref:Uncharacterized protein n=1 Tax=Punica granatum TaxID=22663 RepID=A0A2I0K8A3_PUNGR|nr:hypothetical protein CRG98_014846 [Punica granatum]